MKRLIIAAALAAASGTAQAQEAPAQLAAAETQGFGTIVADAEGRPLYMFTLDAQGRSSACRDACAEAWPPLLTQGAPRLGPDLDRTLIGTIDRGGGARQVTYNGWPLYRFARERHPGEISGQDAHAFGGAWYLVAADGEVIRDDQKAAGPPE